MKRQYKENDELFETLCNDDYIYTCVPVFGEGNIPVDIEWIKWLSYESEYEKKKIEYFNSKEVSELSEEELEEKNRYERNRTFARLFKIYGTSEISKKDSMKVFDYMRTESIEKLMLSKLTSEELQYAKQEITRLSEVSDKQLRDRVIEDQKPERYEQLSMVDAYILHKISEINYDKIMTHFQKAMDDKRQYDEGSLICELKK